MQKNKSIVSLPTYTTEVIFDSSVLIALFYRENIDVDIKPYFSKAIISTVNFCETLQKYNIINPYTIEENHDYIAAFVNKVVPFDEEQARKAAELYTSLPKNLGISLGDRACLALGLIKKIPIITADQIWKVLDLDLEIHVIRDKKSPAL